MPDTPDKKTKKDKVFDVAKPGTSAPTDTSKPVIVTNRPVLSDPMVTDDAKDEPAAKQATTELKAPSASRLKIQPISKPEDVKPAVTPEPEAAADKPTETEDDSSEEFGGSGVSGRDKLKDASQDDQDLVDKKAEERQANLNKIAAAKTYYLPINQVVKRRSKHFAIAGLVLSVVLGLAWLDVALDAGLITIPGVKAPTSFFSS